MRVLVRILGLCVIGMVIVIGLPLSGRLLADSSRREREQAVALEAMRELRRSVEP